MSWILPVPPLWFAGVVALPSQAVIVRRPTFAPRLVAEAFVTALVLIALVWLAWWPLGCSSNAGEFRRSPDACPRSHECRGPSVRRPHGGMPRVARCASVRPRLPTGAGRVQANGGEGVSAGAAAGGIRTHEARPDRRTVIVIGAADAKSARSADARTAHGLDARA